MDLTAGVGLLAGLLTTASLIPQALKMEKLPIIVWNAVSLVLAGAILGMKLRFR